MSSLDNIKDTLRQNLTDLRRRYPIASLAIFGSYARGDETPESDVDILVEFNGDIAWEFFDLEDELKNILQKKVDLVSKGGLKPRHWDYLKSRLQYV
jgi:predicted nucleotidyltransferase